MRSSFRPLRFRCGGALPALLLGTAALLSGCSQEGSPTVPTPAGLYLVEVPGGEQFRIRLEKPSQLAQAERLLRTGEQRNILGTVRAGSGGFNEPWSWHLDPESVSFPEVTVGLCDATPGRVQAELPNWLGQTYCPWGSRIAARLP